MVDGVEGGRQNEYYQGTNVTLVNHADHVTVYADNCCLCRVIRAVSRLTFCSQTLDWCNNTQKLNMYKLLK